MCCSNSNTVVHCYPCSMCFNSNHCRFTILQSFLKSILHGICFCNKRGLVTSIYISPLTAGMLTRTIKLDSCLLFEILPYNLYITLMRTHAGAVFVKVKTSTTRNNSSCLLRMLLETASLYAQVSRTTGFQDNLLLYSQSLWHICMYTTVLTSPG